MKAAALLAAASLCLAAGARGDDTVAPEITSISITPGTVEVGAEDQTITVTLDITDDDSGLQFGNLYLYNPGGHFVGSIYFDGAQRTSGDALEGSYETTMTVPHYGAAGTWRVDGLVRDVANNDRNYGPGNTSFPVPADAQLQVTNGDVEDTASPVAVSAVLSTDTVSTAGGPATVTITVHCQEDLSGFDYGYIYVKDPQGDYAFDLFAYIHEGTRVSGDDLDGTYEIEVTFPETAAAGPWDLDLYLKDRTGNSIFTPLDKVRVNMNTTPSFLAQAVDALQLSFTTSGSGWIHQTEESQDGIDAAVTRTPPDGGEAVMQTTVTGPGTLSFEWRVDSEEFADVLSVEVVGGDTEQISGDTGWATVSLSLPPGEQTVIWRYAKDGSGANGGDKGWVDRVRFVADVSDGELPRLQGLHLSPREADISEGEAWLDISIDVSDDFNGFGEGTIRLFDSGGGERVSTTFSGDFPNTGDSMSGVYQLALPVGDDWPAGKGRVQIELTEASSGLTRIYSPTDDAFPLPEMEVFHVVDGAVTDTAPPVLQALEVTPRVVDVSSGPATVTVTLRVTDEGVGFADGNVALLTPTDDYTGAYFILADESRKHDGIYQVEVEIPQFAVPGTWSLSCFLRDHFSNEVEHPWTAGFGANADPSITVMNTGVIDSTAPAVTASSITPDQIDTSAAGVPVEITISLSEDIAGIRDAYLFFYNPSEVYQPDLFAILDGTTRISGDAMNGTYRVTRTLPQGSEAGTWRVDVFLRDLAGNARSYGPFGDTLPGEGTFVVGGTVPSLFEAFVTTHSLAGDDALPGADPDHDGKNNATELMQGTNPNDAADGGAFAVSRDATHLHFDFTVDPTLTVTANGLFLELDDGGGGAPLRLTGQTQAGLAGAWTDVLPVLQGGITWRISVPFTSGPQGFVRLFFEDP